MRVVYSDSPPDVHITQLLDLGSEVEESFKRREHLAGFLEICTDVNMQPDQMPFESRGSRRGRVQLVAIDPNAVDLSYAERIDHLRNGGGLNGAVLLNSVAATDDSAAKDTIFGRAGLDWFFAYGPDLVKDRDSVHELIG